MGDFSFYMRPLHLLAETLMVSVQLRPFNDRQYTRDLSLLCQRVNEKQLHLPDQGVRQTLGCPSRLGRSLLLR